MTMVTPAEGPSLGMAPARSTVTSMDLVVSATSVAGRQRACTSRRRVSCSHAAPNGHDCAAMRRVAAQRSDCQSRLTSLLFPVGVTESFVLSASHRSWRGPR